MDIDQTRVCAVIAEMLGVDIDTVVPGASLESDLSADSLDIVELVMRFEDDFGIEIPDDEAGKLQTVQDCIDKITEKSRARAA